MPQSQPRSRAVPGLPSLVGLATGFVGLATGFVGLATGVAGLAIVLLLLSATPAHAHATGESYVWLNVEETHLEGRFEMRVDDLREHLSLDIPPADGPGGAEARRAAVLAQAPTIRAYLREHFALSVAGQPVELRFGEVEVMVEAEALGEFAQFFFRTDEMEVPDQIDVVNTILLESDRFHRNLLCIEYDRKQGKEYGEEFTALVFGPQTTEQTLDLTNIEGLLRVRDFIWQGVLHIWIGIDHVLFLIVLLLTAVLERRSDAESGKAPSGGGAWQPVSSFKKALIAIAAIVTIFTVAHSITLALAALDILSLPSRLVESIIHGLVN